MRTSLFLTIASFLVSCSVSKQISKTANEDVLTNKALINAHVGISIFDPATNKYWYDYQGDKYFVPASNTKLPTCYAAMKYLGDSLVGMRTDAAHHYLRFFPTGDPTFLHPDFKFQPVVEFLKKYPQQNIMISIHSWQEQALGSGWAWNDYQEYYMAERSLMPVYGNMVEFSGNINNIAISPHLIVDSIELYQSNKGPYLKSVNRSRTGNVFTVTAGNDKPTKLSITFDTGNYKSIEKILEDTLHSKITLSKPDISPEIIFSKTVIKSQPTDSVLKPMMHRSDNFFAEQMLLMVSNERLGVMNDSKIIDTLLKTDFKDLPQKPRWADGSGLSRYNLFTPQDFVAILNNMRNEFGMPRLKVIMQTGGEGTISSYYKADSGYIYAKTGTLSGVVALSGYLYTKKGKLLIFSTLVNNHNGSATDVRRAIEKFLQGVRARY